MMKLGASIFQLSGLCGDDRDNKFWFEKGYIKNFTDLMNLVHIDSLNQVLQIFTDELKFQEVKGQRLNVSTGAYRNAD